MLVFQISLEGCGASTACTAATAAAYSPILSTRQEGLSLFFSFFASSHLLYIPHSVINVIHWAKAFSVCLTIFPAALLTAQHL